MHSWILIEDKSPWKIMINRSVLINWKLIEKKIELNLDKLNDDLSVVATHIYALSRILHQNGKIENYLIIQNGKPIFLDTVKPFISKKGKI